MKTKKRILALTLTAVLGLGVLAACNSEPKQDDPAPQGTDPAPQTQTTPKEPNSDFDSSKEITVISREASSGTRGAFDELMGIKVKTEGGEEDRLFAEAVTVSSTDEVSAKVEVDPFAIGYTSLGSVNESVKALPVDGAEATEENVKVGKYNIARPFVMGTKGEAQGLAADFLAFAQSKEGQQIVVDQGFIPVNESAGAYSAAGTSGKLTLSGSTSVEKVMEVLREEYIKLNPNAEIEITYNGSGAGIKDALDGKAEIAMASRELTEEEAAQLSGVTFAMDGIAVVVNKDNPISAITSEQITQIFTGEIRTWSALG